MVCVPTSSVHVMMMMFNVVVVVKKEMGRDERRADARPFGGTYEGRTLQTPSLNLYNILNLTVYFWIDEKKSRCGC